MPRLGWVLGLTSAAYFMVVLDSSVVLTALPQMQRDLHASLPSLQWTVNAYGISFAAGIITAAALGDRFGRQHGHAVPSATGDLGGGYPELSHSDTAAWRRS